MAHEIFNKIKKEIEEYGMEVVDVIGHSPLHNLIKILVPSQEKVYILHLDALVGRLQWRLTSESISLGGGSFL